MLVPPHLSPPARHPSSSLKPHSRSAQLTHFTWVVRESSDYNYMMLRSIRKFLTNWSQGRLSAEVRPAKPSTKPSERSTLRHIERGVKVFLAGVIGLNKPTNSP